MAITLADFNKIWASTSPLTPYSFSEANYKQGWNFIGSTPPARQMWDFLQKNNDEKMQYLANNYLPLTGGTMTGEIHREGSLALCTKNDYFVRIDGGTAIGNGGGVILYGKDNASYSGCFRVVANDAVNPFQELLGKPDGTLTWGGKEVERVNASGTNYIRYESGLQICWGGSELTAATAITYPVAFKYVPSVTFSSNNNATVYATGSSGTGFTVFMSTYATYRYIAIGWWK